MAATLAFDVAVVITPTFAFRQSTIWPNVNKLAQEVDAIDAAAAAMLAELQALKSTSP